MSGVIVVCGVSFVIWGGVCERKRGRKRPLKFEYPQKKDRVSLEVKRKKSENDRAFIFEYI